jgi:hypothetical protein
MSVSIPAILIGLIKTASVVVLFAYLVTRTRLFDELLEKHRYRVLLRTSPV